MKRLTYCLVEKLSVNLVPKGHPSDTQLHPSGCGNKGSQQRVAHSYLQRHEQQGSLFRIQKCHVYCHLHRTVAGKVITSKEEKLNPRQYCLISS